MLEGPFSAENGPYLLRISAEFDSSMEFCGPGMLQ
jgi:hypothetical protein